MYNKKMMNTSDSDKNNINSKNFPMDLAQKIALVKPNPDGKGGTIQTPQTFRAIGQPQMRMIAMPAGTVQTSGAAQLIQTHIMSQTMLKQVEASSRTQITALPSRTLTQGGTITVSRATTPSNFISRGATVTNTNLRGNLTTPIRAPTPPSSITNVPFVRGSLPSKTSATAGTTVLSPGSTQTWISGGNVQVQVPTQLIRATNISHSPRQQSRIIAQTSNTVNSSNSGMSTNLNQNISSQNPQQTFVASMSTVLPSRQPTAALVYSSVSNPQHQYTGAGQRVTVATPIGGQRPVRPIQIGNTRLPTSGMGLRVSTTNLSIRAPNVPVLAPTSVLTSISNAAQSRNVATVSTTNLPAGIPAARIIQVQQQQTGGAQVINTTRLAGNLMTLHPVIVNASGAGNRISTTIGTKVQPSLTITHVKAGMGQSTGNASVNNLLTSSIANLSQGGTITISQAQGNQQITSMPSVTNSQISNSINNQHNMQQQQHQQQIAQLVSVNQQGVGNQNHQLVTVSQQQILANSQNQGIGTVVPVAINTRTTNNITGTITSIPAISSSIVNLNSNTNTNIRGNMVQASSGTTILPIAKVLPQQQHITSEQLAQQTNNSNLTTPTSTINNNLANQVLIHTRSPSTLNNIGSIGSSSVGNTVTNVFSNSASFLPTSGTFFYEHSPNANSANSILTLTTSSGNNTSTGNQINTSNMPSIVSSAGYTPSAGSFAVVPSATRSINQIHGIVPSTNQIHSTTQIQTVPVRFNPQLIVDSSQSHSTTAHQIITMSQPQTNVGVTNVNLPQQSRMVVPVPVIPSSPRPSILKKRENDILIPSGITPGLHHSLKAAKNLGPTLMSMSSANVSNVGLNSSMEIDIDRDRDPSPPSRPGSSEGSTTVSATSSPGCDQQEHEELTAMTMNLRLPNEMQFKPVESIYSMQSQSVQSNITNSNNNHQIQHQMSTGSSSNDNNDMTPRKKPRKQQLGGDSLEPHLQYVNEDVMYPNENNIKQNSNSINSNSISITTNNNNNILHNKENTQPVELTIKKPRTSLLENYKQTWKPANNHFQRYSDVKPREERRPNVMDLANQAHVLQKVNGWKIYHLSSQMEDLCELESQVHSKLSNMLQFMETNDTNPDIERVNDLIKGNMQRSKVIIDGVNEARSQIMKIFDHKAHVSDIIHRCASKRNFKKREKI